MLESRVKFGTEPGRKSCPNRSGLFQFRTVVPNFTLTATLSKRVPLRRENIALYLVILHQRSRVATQEGVMTCYNPATIGESDQNRVNSYGKAKVIFSLCKTKTVICFKRGCKMEFAVVLEFHQSYIYKCSFYSQWVCTFHKAEISYRGLCLYDFALGLGLKPRFNCLCSSEIKRIL